METKYIKLTEAEGNRFIRNNKYRLEGNCFMDYTDYYNKDMMNCSNVYDKNWNKRIVIRKCVYENNWDLNVIYKDWMNAPDVPKEKKKPLTEKQQIMVDILVEAFDRWFREDCERELKVFQYDNIIDSTDFKGEYNSVYETIKKMKEEK